MYVLWYVISNNDDLKKHVGRYMYIEYDIVFYSVLKDMINELSRSNRKLIDKFSRYRNRCTHKYGVYEM